MFELPDGTFGICTFICTTPHTKPGALPAYTSPWAWTTMLGSRPMACARFKPPTVHGGSVRPKPVVQISTIDPEGAGLDGPLRVESWLIAAACDEAADSRNTPGLAGTTGSSIAPNCWPS